jgi:hypothetical protein
MFIWCFFDPKLNDIIIKFSIKRMLKKYNKAIKYR